MRGQSQNSLKKRVHFRRKNLVIPIKWKKNYAEILNQVRVRDLRTVLPTILKCVYELSFENITIPRIPSSLIQTGWRDYEISDLI